MAYICNGIDIEKYLKECLSEKRFKHTLGVASEARKLAKHYNADEEVCYIAGLLHDMSKELKLDDLLDNIDKYNLSAKYLDNLRVVHGKVAAKIIEDEFGIRDVEIINAVANHTTARKDMSLNEKVVYIADAIEPNRNYPDVDLLRKLAYEDIDRACLWYIVETLKILKARGEKVIDEDTLMAKAWFEKIIKERNIENLKTITKDGVRKLSIEAAKALDNKKGDDIEIIAIGEKSSIADYMIIASATNERLLSALSDEIESVLARRDIFAKNIEGKPSSGWILLDFGDIIVNLMTYEMRERYNIERNWSDCTNIEMEA